MKFKLISRICQNNKCISNYRFSLMINRKLFFVIFKLNSLMKLLQLNHISTKKL